MAKTILIAEDEPNVLKILARNVKSLGYDVIVAVDGEEALEKIKQHNPDLVLLDIIMPKKNGFGVLQDLRIKLDSKIPVIVLSNLDSEKDVQAGKMYDISDYLVKSNISIRELSRHVAHALTEAAA